jgi:outer membrane murein-binding lipoprotein Lpp
VRMTNWLLGGAAVATLLLAGCATHATINKTIGSGSPFCKDLQSFATEVQGMDNAANEPLSTLTPQVDGVHQSLVKLQGEAPAADTVNGHLLKTDLGTEATAFGALSNALAGVRTSDPNAVGNALSQVNAKYGGALTDATNRLDDYGKSACGVTVAPPNPTTTTAPTGSTTTAGPASTGPATTGPATTAGLPVGPTAPPQTTTAP